MYRTRFGVYVRVVGESEDAAKAIGLRVDLYKYAAILLGAVGCALAGMNLALDRLGLTRREANEFLVYWLPRMQDNPYNLIAFQQEAYTESAKLTVSPRPDSVLRVFMAWKPLARPVDVPAQTLPGFERRGFTLVEWGGAEVR